jgi:hypothetical protein
MRKLKECKGKDHMTDLDTDRMTLEQILEKQGVKGWKGFN